jgi:HK97 family phage portal protein
MSVPLRIRLARAIAGTKAKEYIPALSPLDGWPDTSGRLKSFQNKSEQLTANLNWSYAANRAIVDPAAAIELKAYRKDRKTGELKEASDAKAAELIDLLSNPNNVHTWEQLAGLHYTYMNFNGEGYTMMFRNGQPWTPTPGQLPHAVQEIPANQIQFKLSKEGYSKSTVKYQGAEYPLSVFVRDINPDPDNPYFGHSIISAAAAIINSDLEMREWNNRLMANGAAPSVVFTSNEEMSQEAYERWKQQFQDEHTGAANAGKPLLVEGGDVKPFMLSPRDLDFLESRKFTRDEILAMWRVNPYIIGSVEDVNLATAKAARIQHAEINIEPRVRQWVRQLNATMVSVFDPELILGYEPIVPEDDEAKLKYHAAAANKWETIDEARAAFGDEALPAKLGEQIYMPNLNAPLAAIADGSAKPQPVAPASGTPPADDTTDDDGTNDPEADGTSKSAPALAGVKKKTYLTLYGKR